MEQVPGLTLSLDQYLKLIYGDDSHSPMLHWLYANTQACGHCRIVTAEFASQLFALDPNEYIIHIERYTTGHKDFPFIHTVWSLQEWRESNERVRLARLESLIRRAAKTTKDHCEFMANSVAYGILPDSTASKQFAINLFANAARMNYNLKEFFDYLTDVNKSIRPELDLMSVHKHLLTQQQQEQELQKCP